MDPDDEQFLLFNQEVVGSFPGRPLSPHWRFLLSNVNQGLAQSWGVGGAVTQAWAVSWWDSRLWAPRMPSRPRG